MKFVWRYIWNKLRDIGNEPEAEIRATKIGRVTRADDIESDEGLNITVRAAIGGRIVSFRHYDRQKDRNYWKTYVIPEEMDFERELGKMITLESMRG